MAAALPHLETDRLVMRLPQITDFPLFSAFMGSKRAEHVGGTAEDRSKHIHLWGLAADTWIKRGWGNFTLCLKDGTPIGYCGPWRPDHWPETEFGWTLWSGDYEGKGYITEAMRKIIPWAWDAIGITTAASYIYEPNTAAMAVATRLGATLDVDETARLNVAGSPLHLQDGPAVRVYRHHKGGLPA